MTWKGLVGCVLVGWVALGCGGGGGDSPLDAAKQPMDPVVIAATIKSPAGDLEIAFSGLPTATNAIKVLAGDAEGALAPLATLAANATRWVDPAPTETTRLYRVEALSGTDVVGRSAILSSAVLPSTTIMPIVGDVWRESNDVAINVSGHDDQEVVGFQWRVDGGDWTDASGSVIAVANLRADGHDLTVRAKDADGNLDPTPAGYTFTVEVAFAPSVVIADGAEYVGAREVAVALAANDAIQVELGEDPLLADAIVGTYSPSAAFTLSIGDGKKSLYARFIDDAGNHSAIVSDDIVLDTTAPVVLVASPADGFVTPLSTVEVAGTVEDMSPVTVSVGDSPAEVSGATFTSSLTLGEGAWDLVASAVDAAGNTGNSVARRVVVDQTAPAVSGLLPASGSVTSADRVTVSGQVVDATLVTVTVGGVVAGVTEGEFVAVDVPLAEGRNDLPIVAKDQAGNEAAATLAITRDSTAPKIEILAPLEGELVADSPVLVTGVFEDATTLGISVDGVDATLGAGTFSVLVPVVDGTEALVAKARDAAGNESVSSARMVRVDLTPPALTVAAPAAGSFTRDDKITVHGTVSDASAVGVTVGDAVGAVAGGEYWVFAVPLAEGANDLEVIATDEAGHQTSAGVSLVRDSIPPAKPKISSVEDDPAGKGQRVCGVAEAGGQVVLVIGAQSIEAVVAADGTFCATLPDTEATRVLATAVDTAGNASATIAAPLDDDEPGVPAVVPLATPTARRAVLVYGFAEPGAAVRVTGGLEPASTDARADTGFFLVGARMKTNRSNVLKVMALDAAGHASPQVELTVVENESAPEPNRLLTLVKGDGQRGIAGEEVATPISVMVCDAERRPIPGVAVRFQVVGGGGSVAGAAEVEVVSDPSGLVQASLTLGTDTSPAGNVVLVDMDGNEGPPVIATATGYAANPGGATSVSGVVLGNDLEPVVGAMVLMAGKVAVTDASGSFQLEGIAPGAGQHVFVDPKLAIGPRRYPPMTQVLDVLPGHDNDIGKPIFLPNIDTASETAVSDETGGIVHSALVPDLEVSLSPGQATFPSGSNAGDVFVSPVPPERIPMPLTGGMGSQSVISVLPAGTIFDPPVAVTFPNLDHLPAGSPAEIVSFDHDLGRYKVVGTATVSEDGAVVRSDPGSGIRKGAWHATVPPKTAKKTWLHGVLDWLESAYSPMTAFLDGFFYYGTGQGTPYQGGSFGADPIDLNSGELVHSETDLAVPGRGLSFTFTRTYRSQLIHDGPIGFGWTHNYERRLGFRPQSCTFVGPSGASGPANPSTSPVDFAPRQPRNLTDCPISLPDVPLGGDEPIRGEVVCQDASADGEFTYLSEGGQIVPFHPVGGYRYEGPPGVYSILERVEGAGAVRFRVVNRGGLVESYDALGRLFSMDDPAGNRLRFHHDGENRLRAVIDPLGRVYRFSYDAANRISAITDFTFTRTYRYSYDGQGNMVSVTAPPADGFPDGTTTSYVYASGQPHPFLDHNLLEIHDERGNTILENVYGSAPGGYEFDKVIAQAEGTTTTTFTYERINSEAPEGSPLPRNLTRVVDGAGNLREHLHDATRHEVETRFYNNRRVRSIDPPVRVVRREFNEAGEVTRLVTPRGNETILVYDETSTDPLARGNVLREERGPGRLGTQPPLVTSYTYEPRFQRPKTVTDARGNEPGANPARFTTTLTYDYEVVGDPALNPEGYEHGNAVRASRLQTDLEGITWEIVSTSRFNRFGQAVEAVDAEGNQTLFEYYPESNPSGSRPNARRNLDAETGGYLHRRIDDAGTTPRRTADAEPARLATAYRYDPWGNATEVTAPNGATTTVSFDLQGRLVEQAAPAPFGYRTRWHYDAAGNTVRVEKELRTDKTGPGEEEWLVTEMEYDGVGRLLANKVQVAPGEWLVTRYEYEGAGRLEATTSPAGERTENLYDEADLVYRTTTAAGTPLAVSTTFDYDENGNLARMVDGEGSVTRSEHDPFDRRVGLTSPLGQRTETEWDALGHVVATRISGVRDGTRGPAVLLGAGTQLYDELGSLIKEQAEVFDPAVGPTGSVRERTVRVDRLARPIETNDPASGTLRMKYDGLGRVIATEDDAGNREENTYESAYPGPVATTFSQPDPLTGMRVEYSTRRGYDALGRVTQVIGSSGEMSQQEYDSRGLVTRAVDPSGGVARFEYDGAGRRIAAVTELGPGGISPANPDGLIRAAWQYDRNSLATTLTDDTGKATVTDRAIDGRVLAMVDPAGRTRSQTHDLLGRVRTLTDPTGTIVTRTLDAEGRLTDVTAAPGVGVAPTGEQVFAYDALGRVTYALDENDPADPDDDVVVTRSYDSRGKILAEHTGTLDVIRTYDLAGRRTEIVLPDGSSVGYSYDRLGRAAELLVDGALRLSAEYVGPRLLALSHANGVMSSIGYDGSQRAQAVYHLSPDGSVAAGFEYGFDQTGLPKFVSRVHDGDRGETYGHDKAARLTEWKAGVLDPVAEAAGVGTSTASSVVKYELDGAATRRTVTRDGVDTVYEDDGAYRYRIVGGKARTHDAAGRLTQNERVALSYDAYGRIRSLTTEHGTVRYVYDAMGRRVQRRSGSETTDIVYDDLRPVYERERTSGRATRYHYLGHLMVALDRDGASYAVHHDGLGHVVALTDGAGEVVERYVYGPFGNREVSDASGAPIPEDDALVTFGFAGQRHEPATGLVLFPARALEVETGLFTSPDPMGTIDGPNIMAYLAHGPLGGFDPTGLFNLFMYYNGRSFYEFSAMMQMQTVSAADTILGGAISDTYGWLTGGNDMMGDLRTSLSRGDPILSDALSIGQTMGAFEGMAVTIGTGLAGALKATGSTLAFAQSVNRTSSIFNALTTPNALVGAWKVWTDPSSSWGQKALSALNVLGHAASITHAVGGDPGGVPKLPKGYVPPRPEETAREVSRALKTITPITTREAIEGSGRAISFVKAGSAEENAFSRGDYAFWAGRNGQPTASKWGTTIENGDRSVGNDFKGASYLAANKAEGDVHAMVMSQDGGLTFQWTVNNAFFDVELPTILKNLDNGKVKSVVFHVFEGSW